MPPPSSRSDHERIEEAVRRVQTFLANFQADGSYHDPAAIKLWAVDIVSEISSILEDC